MTPIHNPTASSTIDANNLKGKSGITGGDNLGIIDVNKLIGQPGMTVGTEPSNNQGITHFSDIISQLQYLIEQLMEQFNPEPEIGMSEEKETKPEPYQNPFHNSKLPLLESENETLLNMFGDSSGAGNVTVHDKDSSGSISEGNEVIYSDNALEKGNMTESKILSTADGMVSFNNFTPSVQLSGEEQQRLNDATSGTGYANHVEDTDDAESYTTYESLTQTQLDKFNNDPIVDPKDPNKWIDVSIPRDASIIEPYEPDEIQEGELAFSEWFDREIGDDDSEAWLSSWLTLAPDEPNVTTGSSDAPDVGYAAPHGLPGVTGSEDAPLGTDLSNPPIGDTGLIGKTGRLD